MVCVGVKKDCAKTKKATHGSKEGWMGCGGGSHPVRMYLHLLCEPLLCVSLALSSGAHLPPVRTERESGLHFPSRSPSACWPGQREK